LAPGLGRLPGVSAATVPDRALNILLLGLEPQKLADQQPGADSLTVVHITADRQGIYLVDIPRDMFVDIPGHGQLPLSGVQRVGGTALTTTAVQSLTGLEFDGTVVLTLDALRAVTDALGGVQVCVPVAFSSSVNGEWFPAECRQFDGATVSLLVQERYHLPRGTFDREANIQRALIGLVRRATALNVLSDAGRIAALLRTDGLAVDLPGIDPLELAADLRNITADDLTGVVGSVDGYTEKPVDLGGGVVMDSLVIDPVIGPQLYAALRSDTLGDFAAAHPTWLLRP
jgi:LCP family protein required for cell wall assembly